MDEFSLRLTFLLAEQVKDLQNYHKCYEGGNYYLEAYNEVLKMMRMLNENPTIKITCHEGKFYTQDEIKKKYYIDKF